MSIDDLIYQALLESHADDLNVIWRYVHWLKIRRQINQAFYGPPAHWIQGRSIRLIEEKRRTAHWL